MLANGFGASRGKPDAVNKIPIPKLPTISASLYDDPNALYPPTPTARSSGRAQLLAGLRTAPKTPIGSEYPSIGHFDGEFQGELQSGAGNLNFLMNRNERAFGNDPPRHQLAHSGHLHASRPSLPQDHFNNIQFSNFGGLPTPPTSSHYVYQGDQDYEAQAYADLLARNISLAQQQQQHFIQQLRLAQQTQQLQQIHQQMQPLPIQSAMSQVLGTPPISPAIYTPTASNLSQGHSIYNPNVQTNVQGFTSQQNRHKQGVPSTPLNSTFGGRGDHPIRQPRGPPALEEVIAKPTAKYEGSKNFSSRQRRRALTKLVNAGLERRVTKQVGPASSMMPVSEHDSSDRPGESGSMDHTTRKDTPLDIVSISRPEGRRTPRRMGLAAPHFAAHSAEKRRSAIF
ncbi:hypothetical protein TWF173_002302 [Orbilia oligospora]|nr:hypothetical protein TWF173_002302 [Orbilia oligospora]